MFSGICKIHSCSLYLEPVFLKICYKIQNLLCHPIEYGNDVLNKLSYFVKYIFIIIDRATKYIKI